ncbi:2437_t:CDS:2 [Diversispora eburnea]|uniref:2437_t:CDS:1 n=1 Tax=Diversispora eburnea TaxID=1213867 RepID=A0A9N9CHD6_9GLOM|nr:2437_t:CDS:2 [Diversispora eburnea]
MSTSTASTIHEYFERKASEWNIIDFLEECDLEPYTKKIEEYLKCLETIVNTEKDQRHEKAQELLDNYKQATKEWNNERSRKQIYLHQPTIKHSHKQFHFHQPTINMTMNGMTNGVNGTINGGEFNVRLPLKKDNQEEKDM